MSQSTAQTGSTRSLNNVMLVAGSFIVMVIVLTWLALDYAIYYDALYNH